MPTTTVKTIGTATRDYSTMQAWEDACPANLVTSDEIWKGECYNDSEFTASIVFSGITVDATRYPWLTTASGESAFDDSTNPLTYDQTKGVGVSTSGFSTNKQLDCNVSYTLVEKLQFKFVKSGGYQTQAMTMTVFSTIKDCLVDADVDSYAGTNYVLNLNSYYGANEAKAINVLIIMRRDNASSNVCQYFRIAGGIALNCAAVSPTGLTNAPTGNQFGASASTATAYNCLSLNSGGNDFVGTFANSDYNATDEASGAPGANSTHSLTYADEVVSTTADWKLKSGATSIAAGNTDATDAPNDIFGTVRGTTTAGDVGPHEFVAAGGVTITRTLTDSVDANEPTALRELFVTRELIESVALSDSLVNQFVRNRVAFESVALADVLVKRLSVFRSLSDSLDVIDQVVLFKNIYRQLSDSLAVSDAIISEVILAGVTIISRVLSENINVNDLSERVLHLERVLSDSLAVTDLIDSALPSRILLRSLLESVTAADQLSKRLDSYRTLTESVTLVDSIVRQFFLRRLLQDVLDVNDSVTALKTGVSVISVELILSAIESLHVNTKISEAINIETGIR